MKKVSLVVVLAIVLTFAFVATASATTGKFFANSTSYYQWTKPAVIAPGTASPSGLSGIGDNPTNPGAHANYLATTAKCGMCHSVHRAAASGVKLLPTGDATCAGCHTGSTAVTAKIVTWAPLNSAWIPSFDASGNVTNASGAGGGGGPHNDSAFNLIEDGYWDGTGVAPTPSYEHGARYGCFTRRCHATNPHGANASKYKLFAAKLLFNNSPADDASEYATTTIGSYGGLDAVWDNEGATDAAVDRFVSKNNSIMATTAAGDILIHGIAPNPAETHALVAGLTCGRPSVGDNEIGNDECHAEASYAIVDKGIIEARNHGTGITGGALYRTDNTGQEAIGYGGNDNRDDKTGHVAGSFAATSTHASYTAISGCTSCHDQTDAANTEPGNVTFPHGQTPTGATNLYASVTATTSAVGVRSRLWAGYSGSTVDTKVVTAGTNQKAYDGQCLKCHRDGVGNGIGLTH